MIRDGRRAVAAARHRVVRRRRGGNRWFLQATGYPQVGGGRAARRAHALGRPRARDRRPARSWSSSAAWVATVMAILTGAGTGLFIDEVGKFITASNDYFYPLAAPLIYGLAARARAGLHPRPPPRTVRPRSVAPTRGVGVGGGATCPGAGTGGCSWRCSWSSGSAGWSRCVIRPRPRYRDLPAS